MSGYVQRYMIVCVVSPEYGTCQGMLNVTCWGVL